MATLPKSALTSVRHRAAYTAAEREFSRVLHAYLKAVLIGQRARLPLLRKYPGDPNRLGCVPTHADLTTPEVQLARLEQLTWDIMRFLQVARVGGPIAQYDCGDGGTLEVQTFATRFALIVVERIDHYPRETHDPDTITWSVRRLDASRDERGWLEPLLDAAKIVVGLAGLAS